MSDINTHVLPGFMELLPGQQLEFNRIKQIILDEYQRFGFTPLDTPLVERSEVLLAKAGGETEKQIYRFMKGDNDLSLRFDLTIPLARYVADHFNDLTFPFKRCHIDKVYRGESPQKGRFREFYQCDIDVIGHNELSINYDAEIPCVIYSIFSKLNIGKFTVRLNNRKILAGLMNHLCLSEKASDVLRIIDKMEKISREELNQELSKLGLTEDKITKLLQFTSISGNAEKAIESLKDFDIDDTQYIEGVNELDQVTKLMKTMGVDANHFAVDLSIARGLDYYTGTVYETILDEHPNIGSICSGGRYDNLASFYTNEKLPGVGISIGLTRLFYQLNEIGLIDKQAKTIASVLVMPFGNEQIEIGFKIANAIREFGINTDILLDEMTVKKRFQYADRLGVKFVVVIGDDEIKSGNFIIQNMITGDKISLTFDDIASFLKNNIK
jgi:histidyl-tRNA synthetase